MPWILPVEFVLRWGAVQAMKWLLVLLVWVCLALCAHYQANVLVRPFVKYLTGNNQHQYIPILSNVNSTILGKAHAFAFDECVRALLPHEVGCCQTGKGHGL